ncbi:hypothetical protein SDC9_145341 [bioreactor metagenome]|uniref:Uncharacterized protein n=1 Tax=bioreactor metagenome TaxID=1076179 RepID=A0A645EAK1_9ZZZZ
MLPHGGIAVLNTDALVRLVFPKIVKRAVYGSADKITFRPDELRLAGFVFVRQCRPRGRAVTVERGRVAVLMNVEEHIHIFLMKTVEDIPDFVQKRLIVFAGFGFDARPHKTQAQNVESAGLKLLKKCIVKRKVEVFFSVCSVFLVHHIEAEEQAFPAVFVHKRLAAC